MDDEPPQKRFRYATYTQQINQISVDTGKLKALEWEDDDSSDLQGTQPTPFTSELDRLAQLDLTLPFQEIHKTLQGLTTTLPITLHNLPAISLAFHDFYGRLTTGQDLLHSGLDSTLQLHRAIFDTTLGEGTQYVPQAVEDICRIAALRALEPKIVERAYSTLSLILRTMAGSLLKPGSTDELRASWDAIRPYLSSDHKKYVRRCVADAWVGVIRKARGDGLQRLTTLLLGNTADAMEAVWAHSLRGSTGQLHSRAVPIYDSLLDDMAANPSAGKLDTMIKVTTSLVHHTTSTTIIPIVESVLKRISNDQSSSTPLLRLLSALLYTRKGKRYPENMLRPTMVKLMETFPNFSEQGVAAPEWRRATLQAVVGSLTAGKLAQWLSPGVAFIEKFWEAITIEERFAFVNALIKLRWSGVEQFLIPHIARTVLPSLSAEPLHSLILLNNLADAGFLTGSLYNVQGGRWRQALVAAIGELLDTTTSSDLDDVANRRVMGEILHLLPSMSSAGVENVGRVVNVITKIMATIGTAQEAKADWEMSGAWNKAHLLAEALQAAASFSSNGAIKISLQERLVDSGTIVDIASRWSWHREILDHIAGLTELWSGQVITTEWNVSHLYPNLLSSDASLRRSTLRILSTLSAVKPSSSTEAANDIWSLCLQVENAEMSLRNVRERTNQISRLSRAIAALPKNVDSTIIDHAISYLLSQLKVNFRPLYTETIKALGEVGGTYGEAMWSGVWAELEKVSAANNATLLDIGQRRPSWAERRSSSRDDGEEEEEPEYRCPNADKNIAAVNDSWVLASDIAAIDWAEVPSQINSERLDILNYEAQLLGALAVNPLIAEKHTRSMIPAFFAIAGQLENVDESTLSAHLSTRQRQQRTGNWLELFAKFVNPKAAFRSEELHGLYLRILSKGDIKLQGLAVRCLLTYKSANLVPYQENLLHLLEDAKFRDELARFSLSPDSDAINETHRGEIIPVTIRLLYGILTARRGRSSAQGLQARKRAVLSALSGCSSDELKVLVDLMLEPFEAENNGLIEAAGRQQTGFLSLLADMLKYLAPQTVEHWPRLINVTVRLIGQAQTQISKEAIEVINDDIEMDEDELDDMDDNKGGVPVRQIRSTGIKRLVQFLRAPVDFSFSAFLPDLYSVVISPRLDKLEIENTQGPSGVLDLIAAIASLTETASSLVKLDKRTLPKTFSCLTAVKVKPAVIVRVFDIIESLLESDSQEILLTHIRPLLDNVIRFVEARAHTANDELMRRLLTILSRLSVIVTDGQQAQQLASLLCPMLRQAGKQQPERMKIHVLETLQRLFLISPDFSDPTSEFFTRSYDLMSNLLQTVYLPGTRRAVVGAIQTFVASDPSLANIVRLVSDLNAYSAKRLEEPDFDKRLTAFASLNDAPQDDLPQTIREWSPLLRSALFFIKDPEELSIRTNSSSLLKRFIDLVGAAETGAFVDTINHIIIPGLRQSIRSKIELVRNEAMVVVAHAVQICDGIPALVELRPLAGDDDDTSFFVNISHIQVHRRARALRRLRDTVQTHEIRESTYANVFLPILEHIIAGSTEVTDHHLVNEAILTVGALAGKLRWSKYNGVLSRYLKLGNIKSAQQKLYIRAVSSIIDHFHFDLLSNTTAVDVDEIEEPEDEEEDETGEVQDETATAAAGAETKRISEIVLNRLLPSLSRFVSQKDENEDSIRIPLALPTVKLAKQLPGEIASNEIIKVVTIVSQILRSKDQDTRDIARDTIGRIAVFLGPAWLNRILAELQTALQRGPQKHVAAVVTHSILVLATTEHAERFSDLDESVNDAIRMSAEVVWGESGKDVANDGFKTKMREVRGASSRGYDTFQLLSRLVSPAKISIVLAPIREVMHASQAVKTMSQVDEALRRVALGLNANSRVHAEDVLTLCHSLVSGNSAYLKPKRKVAATSEAADSYRVQMKRNRKQEEDFYHLNAHKFVTFGLDLFVTAFRRGKFDFENIDILARLGPLVNAIGNTLYSPISSVLLLALKATAAIARCPIPQVEEALPAFVSNIVKVVKNQGGSAETEVSQTALKTLAVILRDSKAAQLTDTQLRYLLEVVSPDLEETDRQASIFAILRAIVSRRMIVPEIYDLMGSVSSIMVTSQSTHVQELCRGVLMTFLLDYPQGKGRVKSQLTFLAQNLDYVYESGRVSVMELLNAVFTKFTEELIEEYADLFFVALVAVIANDDSEKCRNMAGALLQTLFGRLETERLSKMVDVLKSWIGVRDTQPALADASLAVFGLLADVDDVDPSVVVDMVISTSAVIDDSATALADAEASESAFAAFDMEHTMPHHALVAAAKGLKITPGSADSLPWNAIIAHLLFPHDWVRLAAARAIGSSLASTSAALDDAQCLDIAKKSCILLQGSRDGEGRIITVDAKLADQLVKLLWNISKRWSAKPDDVSPDAVENDIEEEEAPTSAGSLTWLMSRMSFVARYIMVHRPSPNSPVISSTHWTAPLMSILRFFAGVLEHLQVNQAKRFVLHVLSPIHRVLDEDGDLATESGPEIDDLKQLATEVRDFVQSKVGTTEFSRVWEDLRKKVSEKRGERRDARSRMAVSDPQAWAERKSKKVVQKKDSKKRKVKAFAEGRVQSAQFNRKR